MVGRASSFDLFAQQYIIPGGTDPGLMIAQYAPPVNDPFAIVEPPDNSLPGDGTSGGGTGNVVASTAVLDFAPMLSAWPSGPLPNGVAPLKGTYNGIFYDTNGVATSDAGYFSAVVSYRATYTGKLSQGGRTYSFTGKFDANGKGTSVVARPGTTPFLMTLQLDAGTEQIHGYLKSSTLGAELLADRAVYGKGNLSPQAGVYTLVVPGNMPGTASPGGYSVGTVKVDTMGRVQFSGALSDGTKITQSSAVSRDGIWPLYASAYGGSGLAIGWLKFDNQAASDLSGQVVWLKYAGTMAKSYPGGFTNMVSASGSKFSQGTKALVMTTGQLVLSGGGLVQPITNVVNLTADNRITIPAGSKLKIKLTTTTGLFQGTTVDPATHGTVTFQGVLLKKANYGAGFSINNTLSGQVYLSPVP